MKLSKLLIIVFSFLFAINLYSQDYENTIKGKVINTNKEAIEGVNVYLPEIYKGTITDKNGMFTLKDVTKKNTKVQFSILGYKTIVKSLSDNLSEIELQESILEIEEVVISAGFVNTADRSSVKIESISLEELSFHSSPSLTLALADEPSVEMVKLGNSITKPVIRGLSGNRVVVLYQGARTSNQAWGEEHGVFIPEEGIEKVEIVKGPASLLYGSDAMGGVLNFIPLKPLIYDGRKNKFSTSYFSSSDGIQSSFLSQKKRRNWFHTYGLGYQNHADYQLPNKQYALNSRFVQHYAFGNWGISNDWGILKGVYSSSYTNTGLVDGISDESERHMENPWQQVGDHIVTTEGVFWLNNWTIKPFISYQLNHRKEFEEEHEEDEEAALDMSLRTLRYDLKSVKSSNNFEMIFGTQGMYQTNNNDEHAHELLIPNAETKDISIYSLFNKKLEDFQIQTGGRIDYRNVIFNENDLDFLDFSYSLGGTYNFSNKYILRANIAKGFRAPNLYELSADGEHHGAHRYESGDVNLKSENNLESDFSLHVHGQHYAFDIAVFHNQIKDYIYITPATDTTEEGMRVYEHRQNDARLYGGEAGLDFHPHLLHDLHIKSTFSLVFADNIDLEKPLAMTPAHKWNNELEYEFKNVLFADKLKLSLNYNYHFKQDRIEPEEEVSEAYSLINASIGWYKGRHQLSLHGQNLLNTEYIPHLSLLKEIEGGVFEQGRSFALKYSINF
ncbi:MAG: TonB-dependent receptor [Flavobacteriales bacterium]|jgi:iron complex outermembrane recepter protein|nr:TonB-dependent receptor [Flavobacteriales bacterium]